MSGGFDESLVNAVVVMLHTIPVSVLKDIPRLDAVYVIPIMDMK